MPAETDAKSVPNDVSQMTKLQKLACLLIIVGPEAAAMVMKNLGDTELEAVATEMTKIPSINQEMQLALLKDFSAVAHEGTDAVLNELMKHIEKGRAKEKGVAEQDN